MEVRLVRVRANGSFTLLLSNRSDTRSRGRGKNDVSHKLKIGNREGTGKANSFARRLQSGERRQVFEKRPSRTPQAISSTPQNSRRRTYSSSGPPMASGGFVFKART